MPDITTFSEAQAAYVQASDYDVVHDVAQARRFIVAARALLGFAASAARDGTSLGFDLARVEQQLQDARVWLAANEQASEAQRLANPDVTHADFSTFRGYH